MTRKADFLLPQRQRFAARNAQLPFDQVESVIASVTGARPAAGYSSP
jgi:hypothetical protein